MSITTPKRVRRTIQPYQPKYRQHRFLSGWYFKFLAFGFLATLLSCNYRYLVVQPLGDTDENGLVRYHLISDDNHILIMYLHPGLKENHVVKLTRKERKEAE